MPGAIEHGASPIAVCRDLLKNSIAKGGAPTKAVPYDAMAESGR